MSTLTSSSTDAEVEASYDDNASYHEDGSASKALAFATACLFLIRRSASKMRHGPDDVEYDVRMLQDQRERAVKYAELNGGTGASRVIKTSFTEGRE